METVNNLNGIQVFLFSLGIVAVLGIFYFLLRQKKKKKGLHEQRAQAYVAALNELIAGDNRSAMELFKEAVRFDTNNIDAYLKLGMLYRLENNPGQALKIHKELTIRSGVKKTPLIEIYRNIINDLIDLRQYDEALVYCEKMLSADPKNRWALEIQPEIYEKKRDWKNAFKALKAISDKSPETDHRLAVYKTASGKTLMDIGEFHDARLLLKEAIKLDRSFPPAHLFLGDAYARQERRDDAVKAWRDFAEAVPEKSYLVFDYLDKAYFEAGNYGAMEVFLTKMIEKDSDNYHVLVRLGEIYFKKGEKEKAFEMTERGMKVNPHSPEALGNLIMYLNNTSDLQLIKEKALSLAKLVTEPVAYVCRNCGESSDEIQIQCPSCGKLDVFQF
ncbi:tetratricopeptide repeat protein [candidate division KSB1 bacterium]